MHVIARGVLAAKTYYGTSRKTLRDERALLYATSASRVKEINLYSRIISSREPASSRGRFYLHILINADVDTSSYLFLVIFLRAAKELCEKSYIQIFFHFILFLFLTSSYSTCILIFFFSNYLRLNYDEKI